MNIVSLSKYSTNVVLLYTQCPVLLTFSKDLMHKGTNCARVVLNLLCEQKNVRYFACDLQGGRK